MPIDVIKVATSSGNVANNGSATVGVNKFGVGHFIPPKINKIVSPEGVEALYEDRFDDPRYHSGDTPD